MDINRWQPFVYWSQRRQHDGPGESDTEGQRYCFVLWSQEEGTATLTNGGEAWTLRPGQVLLADPGLVARWRRSVVYTRLAFDLTYRKRSKERSGHPQWYPLRWTAQPPLAELLGGEVPRRIPADECPAVRHLMASVRMFYWRSGGEHLRCSAMVGQWLLDYASRHGASLFDGIAAIRGETLADRADAIISHQLDARPSIAEVAEQLGVSREHLSRTYRKARGIALRDAIVQVRLRDARGQLELTDQPLSFIAQHCGFGSPDVMRAAFIKHLGCLPKEYRLKHRSRGG